MMHLKLNETSSAEETERKGLRFKTPTLEVSLEKLEPSLKEKLQSLSSWVSEESLTNQLPDLAKLYYYLELLKKRELIEFALFYLDKPFVTFNKSEIASFDKTKIYRLSKFALIHLDNNTLLLETPLSPSTIKCLHPNSLRLFHSFSKGQTLDEACSSFPDLPPNLIESVVALFIQAKVLEEDTNEDPIFAQWEFHDLLFHTRSRVGRHNNPYGGTFPFREIIKHAPACKKPSGEKKILLPKPDLEECKKNDPTLLEVMEKRRSTRDFDDNHPLSIQDLGTFLYRVQRIKSIHADGPYERVSRPYPGGGAMYEIEIYPVIRLCSGLDSGLFHYDSKEHALYQIPCADNHINALLNDAQGSTGMPLQPQILFILSARFQRMAWKYRSMAYAATLKHVGVLYQTMYLVATAMDIGACGIGGGNADLFAEAAKTNYYEETSVGEFMLGSKKKGT